MTIRHITHFLPVYLVCCSPLQAAPQQISVRTMALGSGEMPELYFETKGETKLTPAVWSKRQPSRMVSTIYEDTLSLFRLEVDEDGQEIPVIAHQVKVPEGANEILLFGWLNKSDVNFQAITDDFLKAAFDDWLLINLSSKRIDFLVGRDSKPIRLNSKRISRYKITAKEDKGGAVYGRANIRGEERIFYSTFLPISANRRTIMLFTDDGDKIRTTPVIDHFNRRKKPPE
ncbi:MAG: hypothetical protein AB8D78_15040 [Akkermansiaceae bacterium]